MKNELIELQYLLNCLLTGVLHAFTCSLDSHLHRINKNASLKPPKFANYFDLQTFIPISSPLLLGRRIT